MSMRALVASSNFSPRTSLPRPSPHARVVSLMNHPHGVVPRARHHHVPSRVAPTQTRLRAAKGSEPSSEAESDNKADAIDVKGLTAELMDGSKLGSRGELMFVGQSIAVALCVFTPDFFDPVASAAGVASLVGGTVLAGFAFKDLGNSLSPLPKPREDSKLVTTGVYSYARHPMYAGLNLVFLGVALLSGSRAKFLVFLALLVVIDKKASLEESFLAEQFGEEWKEYSSRVSKIIPFLY